MTSTVHAPTLDLVIEAAPPPQLPAVAVLADAAVPAHIEPPLTATGLSEMLARRKKRSDGWTPIRVAAFIEALAETCSVSKAAAYVDMSTASAYHLRNHPDAQGFREAWDHAVSARFEELTDIAMDRVRNGVEKARWWKDTVVGYERVFSDRLLIQMLRRSDPHRIPVAEPVTAPPPTVVLPLAEDFIVAAAVDTGRLGWDPDHDLTEADWPPETIAAVEAKRAAHAKGVADDQALLDERMRLDRIENSAAAARLNAERAKDAEIDEDLNFYAEMTKSLTCSSSGKRRSK